MTSRTSSLVLRSLKGRLYGTSAAATSDSSAQLTKQSPRVTKLDNGLTVASLENYSPISQVALIVNAGSRFESYTNAGVTHFLRSATNLSTLNWLDTSLVRAVEECGGNLGCTGTREYMIYSAETLRNQLFESNAAEILRDVAINPLYDAWQVENGTVQQQMVIDIANMIGNPEIRLMEMIHEAAYRDTLGRSLYSPFYHVNKFQPDQLKGFHSKMFTNDRMALVGLGVDHDQLVEEGKAYVQGPNRGGSTVQTDKAVYHGDNLRLPSDEPMTHVAIVTEGPSLSSKDLYAVGVLQMIMGTGPHIKYSENTTVNRLGKGVGEAIKNNPFAASCINANYTDSGIFGFYLCAQAKDMGQGIKAAMNAFANVSKNGVTDEDVVRGKNQLMAAIGMNMEDSSNVLLDLAEQAISSNKITTSAEVLKMIDAVQTSDVTSVAKKVIGGKPSMAAIGDLQTVPYLDELKK
ncbi:QCR2 [Mytilus coruscus]|uniref:QCR2 n=1 Tax=Mytilus coruscus TaxID=42192 RepID=A0A6J8DQ02_MYTCO|nr:QCR2 [Mytilus coruscus]